MIALAGLEKILYDVVYEEVVVQIDGTQPSGLKGTELK